MSLRALIDSTDTKVCRKCSVEKPLKDFHPNKACDRGVVGTCRECTQSHKRVWYSKNQERRSRDSRDRARAGKLRAIKYMGEKCFDCKQTYPPYVYQFHHLDMSVKERNPSYLQTSVWDKQKAELDKCVMLCSNCHMIRHYSREGEE